MARPDAAVLSLAALVAVEGTKSLPTYLPPLSDVRRAQPSDGDVSNDVHIGMVVAFAQTFAIAATLAVLTDSQVPLVIGVVSFGVMALTYEWTLRRIEPV